VLFRVVEREGGYIMNEGTGQRAPEHFRVDRKVRVLTGYTVDDILAFDEREHGATPESRIVSLPLSQNGAAGFSTKPTPSIPPWSPSAGGFDQRVEFLEGTPLEEVSRAAAKKKRSWTTEHGWKEDHPSNGGVVVFAVGSAEIKRGGKRFADALAAARRNAERAMDADTTHREVVDRAVVDLCVSGGRLYVLVGAWERAREPTHRGIENWPR